MPYCFFVLVCLYLSRCWSPVLLRFHRQHWESMAGKNNRKHHQPSGDTQEACNEGVEERSMLELFIANQNRRDEEMLERAAEARKEQLAAEERAEERRLKAEIAAEEREEKRRERAKIAEEERMEARALDKERRKREEADRLEERNREKEEAAKQAVERAAEMQEEANKKAYEQQKVLMELQADLGRKAAEAHRIENDRSRQRDRVISSLPIYQKEEDVEEFLLATERKLRLGEIPEGEWLALVAAKLNGEVGASWQELCMGEGDYQAVRAALLKGSGYTPRAAGEAYHAFRFEHLRGLAGDQVYRKGAQLLKRMVAPMVLDKEMLFRLVKPWVYACVGRRARAVLDARVVEDAESLVRGLQDYLASEGDRVSGKTAVFGGEGPSSRRQAYHSEPEKERRKAGMAGGNSGSSMKCFKCGKLGHKAADCWQGGPGAKQAEGSSMKIVCYICGVEGHKATVCPGRKEAQKGASPKQVKQVKLTEERDTILQGKVNGKGASLLLDSGAHITVVPKDMVGEELKTGESVVVKAFQSETPMRLPTAKVTFEVNGMEEWEETVALAPVEEGKETEVLYGLKLRSPRGLDLVILANRLEEAEVDVRRVTTRAEAKQENSEKEENARVVEVEKPRVRAAVADTGVSAVEKVAAVGKIGVGKRVEAEGKTAEGPSPSSLILEVVADSEKSTGEGGLVADRPASNPEPVAQIAEVAGDSVVGENVTLQEEVDYCLRKGGSLEDLEVPPVRRGPGDRAELVEEVKKDPTLEGYRSLAEKGEQGFLWERGLLYQAKAPQGEEVVHAIVLPKRFRSRVLEMAHEGSGHLGARKVKALLKQRFVWPGMGVDAINHTRSCEVCQRCSKTKSRKAPLMERQVMSEPFKVLAFDLVGPFPKAKNGFRFVLTAICMGSKWPEAVPLKSETARAVASGMVEIFARTGIPLQLLSD